MWDNRIPYKLYIIAKKSSDKIPYIKIFNKNRNILYKSIANYLYV